jgi:hypothetical protein
MPHNRKQDSRDGCPVFDLVGKFTNGNNPLMLCAMGRLTVKL